MFPGGDGFYCPIKMFYVPAAFPLWRTLQYVVKYLQPARFRQAVNLIQALDLVPDF